MTNDIIQQTPGVIYRARLKKDGRVYIGQTWNFNQRKKDHVRSKDGYYFHKALRKYGVDFFQWDVICEVWTQQQLDDCENYFVDYYDSTNRKKGFNLKKGGRGGKHLEITKRKLSMLALGNKHTQETKDKISAASKNRSMKHLFTPEVIKKRIESMKRNNKPNKNIGRKLSNETKQKLREANLGKKLSAATIEKLRLRMIGNKYSVGSKPWLGKKLSEQHKKKLAAAKLNKPTKYWLGKKLPEEMKNKIKETKAKNKLDKAAAVQNTIKNE